MILASDTPPTLCETLREDRRASDVHHTNECIGLAAMLLNHSLIVVLFYRLSAYFFARDTLWGRALAKIFWRLNILQCACDIDRQSVIGPGLQLPHPIGIVIGAGVRIGKNAIILQNVTLGVAHPNSEKNDGLYPVIGDNVRIHAGAVIIGGITIGDNAEIGANAVVTHDVPANHIALGIPARCRPKT